MYLQFRDIARNQEMDLKQIRLVQIRHSLGENAIGTLQEGIEISNVYNNQKGHLFVAYRCLLGIHFPFFDILGIVQEQDSDLIDTKTGISWRDKVSSRKHNY
jgi:hypothetical protein